ncbi:disease resistance protein RPS2-like [Olea europaea var. sylvestris]|uniref:disease resistance protein RPS2-like n=1 Tax=Olea europaea var. sylvestris TaxID=158386 RepID=UPI000C1D7902|nr:disease resistance protein RPS2-like [Olea europaea var. sylvestris]
MERGPLGQWGPRLRRLVTVRILLNTTLVKGSKSLVSKKIIWNFIKLVERKRSAKKKKIPIMAEGIAYSVLGKLAGYAVDPVLNQIKCLLFYSNMQNLQDKVKDLVWMRDRVKDKVKADDKNGKITGEEVQSWLEKVNVLENKADEVLKDVDSSEVRCLFNGCQNLMSRYFLSRTALKIIVEADKLIKAIKLKVEDRFWKLSSSPPPNQLLNVGFHDGFGTRLLIKKKIIEALEDKDIGIIGICGMPGVGKTTMAKEICKEVKGELFEEVAFAVVSNNPDITNIQDQLAEALGLTIEERTTEVRAGALYGRLERNVGKRILIILDDVWEEIDLGTIGIPSPHDCEGLKIMFTTRNEKTCCQMESERKFKIEVLDEVEGWQLFKDAAGISDDKTDSEIVTLAKKVADECGRLPLALVVVGKALKSDKAAYKWRDALRQLQSCATCLDGMEKIVYKSIRLSYDHLASNEERKLLLLCSLFAEDESIPIENLVRYAKGLGLFKIETLHETQDRAKTIIDNLKSCNLLQPGDVDDEVKLHDVIRDFCLQMSTTDGKYLVKHAGLTEWPEHDADELYSAISITIDKLRQLPSGIHSQLSMIGSLKKLEILSFYHSFGDYSPIEFTNLCNLRSLDLRFRELSGPLLLGVLSGMKKLEELYLKCFNAIKGEDAKIFKNLVCELEGNGFINLKTLILSHGDFEYLIDATNTIPGGTFGKLEFLELNKLPKLREICNGNIPRVVIEPSWFCNLLTVNIFDCESITSLFQESVAKCLVNLQSLTISSCQMLEVVSTDARENEVIKTCEMLVFPKLKIVDLKSLSRFKSFTSQSNSDVSHALFNQVNFPNMEWFRVDDLGCIVTLLGKEMQVQSLHKLALIAVFGCSKLLAIAESDSIQLLQNLERLTVWKCNALDVLFDFEGIKVTNDDEEIDMLGRLIKLWLKALPKLVHITRMVPKKICVFQNLTTLNVANCNSLK